MDELREVKSNELSLLPHLVKEVLSGQYGATIRSNNTWWGGVSVDRYGKRAGKGALVKVEHAPCIAAAQDTTLFILECNNMDAGHKERLDNKA